MSKLCCIPICRNSKPDRRHLDIPCYPFPASDEELRVKWIDFVVLGGTAASTDPQRRSRFRWKTKLICAEHFHGADLADNGPVEGAVPTVYCPEETDEDILAERDQVMVSSEISTRKNETGSVDLTSMFCRICLKKAQAGLIPFNSKLHNENLVDVVYTVTGLVLDEKEANLPKKICASCVGKIDVAFNVRKDILHHEQVLRNMIENGQLEAHFRCYDNHVVAYQESREEAYLNNLMKDVKTELIIEPLEEMVEEHLQDEQDDTAEQPPTEDQDAPESKLNVEIYSDSEGEKEASSSKKIVYSWKELAKPKRPRQVKVYKITEDLPEPTLVPNTCYICDTVHKDGDDLDNHVEQHVQLIPYTCAQCSTEEYPIVLKSLVSLNKHLQSHLYAYVCDYCPLRYINRKNYTLHMKTQHESFSPDGYTCDDCGQYFSHKRAFSSHVYKHRVIKEGKYKCEDCGKAFSNLSLLTRHRRIHTGEKPYQCNKCGRCFNHESIFQEHKRTHIGLKAYVCSECGKRFVNAPMLRYHMAEHFPDDPRYRTQYSKKRPKYEHCSDNTGRTMTKPIVSDGKHRYAAERVCEYENCTYRTSSIQSWHYHQGTHTRKFQCEICSVRYPTKQCLTKHVETVHEGKKPEKKIPCTYCDKKFSNNQKLRFHIDMHENNRRYKCSYCEKAFVQLANMKAHERIHTGEKPFPCRVCPSAFITSSGRRKHEKTHPELNGPHGGIPIKVDYTGGGDD